MWLTVTFQKILLPFQTISINWIVPPVFGQKYGARIRYQQPLQSCSVDGNSVIFDEPQESVSTGQSVVIYDGEICIGGGVIA